MSELFIPVDLQRNLGFESWHSHNDDALKDYKTIGGKGVPPRPAE